MTTTPTAEPVDVLVVGAGPAGYTAAIYAARAGLSVRVLAGHEPGGALATTTQVDNYPGFADGVMGPELMQQMYEQAERVGAQVLFEHATAVDLTPGALSVTTEEATHVGRAVVLATGAAHRELGVPGEHLSGVSYCATCDGVFFAGKPVVVVGGGDSACEEALYLADVADSVTLLVRSGAMRASAAMRARVEADARIEVRYDSPVARIIGQSTVTGVELVDGTLVPASGVFVAIGHDPRSDLVAGQLELDRDGYVRTAPTSLLTTGPVTATSVPGVFAAGDVVDRRYRQAITAAASGCQAALDAYRWLRGEV